MRDNKKKDEYIYVFDKKFFHVWDNREEALNYYEHFKENTTQYDFIHKNLVEGKNVINASQNKYCEFIYDRTGINCKSGSAITLLPPNGKMTMDKAINYWENELSIIKKIGNKYNLEFHKSLVFFDFKSDDTLKKLKKEFQYPISKISKLSYSNYYKDVLKEMNIEIKKINTLRKNDKEYICSINDEEICFKVHPDDRFGDVLNNINKIKRILNKDKYKIKIWETEEDKEEGISFEYLDLFNDVEDAINEAKRLMRIEDYACIEVQNIGKSKVYYWSDGYDEEFSNMKKESNIELEY